MKYTKPLNETNEDAGYVNADVSIARRGSTVPAEAIEAPQREIVAAITAAGLTPDADDNTQLSQAIKAEIKADVQDIVPISATSGTVALNANTLYKMTISGATTFTLPSAVNATKHNQIKMFLNLSQVVTVNWGTSVFFNETAPDIATVGTYCIYWDYDPNAGTWICGAMKEGAAT